MYFEKEIELFFLTFFWGLVGLSNGALRMSVSLKSPGKGKNESVHLWPKSFTLCSLRHALLAGFPADYDNHLLS